MASRSRRKKALGLPTREIMVVAFVGIMLWVSVMRHVLTNPGWRHTARNGRPIEHTHSH